MPPATGWWSGAVECESLLGSVIARIILPHDGTAGTFGGAFLAGIRAYMGLHGRFYRLIAGRPAGPILAAGKGFGSGREPKFPPLQDRNQDSRAGLFPQPTALGEHRL